MVNARVEMPRTSCHLSIFSWANEDSSWAWRQAGLDGPRCRRRRSPGAVHLSTYYLKFEIVFEMGHALPAAGAGHQGPCT